MGWDSPIHFLYNKYMKHRYLYFFSLISLLISCSSSGREVSLANETVMKFWDEYESAITQDLRIPDQEQYYPVPLHYDFDDASNREINISTSSSMKNATTIKTNNDYVDIENLYMGTGYYVRIDEVNGDKVTKGKVEKIHTSEYPRTIKVGNVSNTRDIGGYRTKDGKRIAQGKVYRGANLDSISTAGKNTMLKDLYIKTDLDLRAPGEGTAGTESPLGINYVNISGAYYASGRMSILYEMGEEAIKKEIMIFTNPDNYPIYFHCAIGRDRTGTLAMILEALLGVDSDTILKEYELSFLSNAAFPTTTMVYSMMAYAEQTLGYIVLAGQEDPKDSLAKCTERWLIDYIGITKEDINAIKKQLLVK